MPKSVLSLDVLALCNAAMTAASICLLRLVASTVLLDELLLVDVSLVAVVELVESLEPLASLLLDALASGGGGGGIIPPIMPIMPAALPVLSCEPCCGSMPLAWSVWFTAFPIMVRKSVLSLDVLALCNAEIIVVSICWLRLAASAPLLDELLPDELLLADDVLLAVSAVLVEVPADVDDCGSMPLA